MICPRDGEQLDPQLYWQFPRHFCASCDGLLIGEQGVLYALGQMPGTDFAASLERRIRKLPPGTLQCPRDGGTMHVLAYRGIELDACPSCRSLWFDKGEHDQVMKVRTGPTYGGPEVSMVDGTGLAVEAVGWFVIAALTGLGP